MTEQVADTVRDAAQLLAGADLVLLDLDGCLIFGDTPHPAAARLIARLAGRYVVVSNNSTETPESMAELLQAQGLAVTPDRILLAGALMIEELVATGLELPTALFAGPRLGDFARSRGLCLVDPLARADGARVAIARHTTLSYDSLNAALGRLADGAPLIVSNPDLTHPGPNRRPVIETGGLLALFQACLPDLSARIIGKPEPLMFEAALRRFNVPPDRAVMVGDNPQTDGAGARRVGMASILVGPHGRHESIADLL